MEAPTNPLGNPALSKIFVVILNFKPFGNLIHIQDQSREVERDNLITSSQFIA
jgi:hypothetical protein